MTKPAVFRARAIFASAMAAALGCFISGAVVLAQTANTPKKIALVSMVGDEFAVVTKRQVTGSNVIDNYKRHTMRVPGQGINMSVLRGLDEAVRREFPDSERVLLAISHDNETLPPQPQARERAAYEKAISLIAPMKERQDWDQIVLVTPRWLFSEREGMASKLSGIGLFVQPLESATLNQQGGDTPGLFADLGLKLEDEIDTLKRGETSRSQTYVAPFFYAVVTTLDAKTLQVIKRDERYDFRKVTNPDSAAIRISNAFDPDQLAGVIDKFIETAALRSVTDKRGTVEIGPIRDSRSPPAPPQTK